MIANRLTDRTAQTFAGLEQQGWEPDEAFANGIEERVERHHRHFQSVSPNYYQERYGEFGGAYGSDAHLNKALPYDDMDGLLGIQRLGHMLKAESGFGKTILNYLSAYAIGKGISYTLKPRKRYRGNKETQSDVEFGQEVIDLFISDNCWSQVQKEALKDRLVSSGDLIRRYDKSGDTLNHAFVDSHELAPPDDWQINGRSRPDFGIEYSNGQITKPTWYWINGERVRASLVQHTKVGTDSRDERGVPVMWTEFPSLKECDEIDYAAARSAIQFSKHCVNKEYPPHTTSAQVAQVMAAEDEADEEAKRLGQMNAGGGVHQGVGYKITGMGHTWSAAGYMDQIDSKMRRSANVAGLPAFLSTGNVDTGGRNSLISAESGLTRTVEDYASMIAKFDIELLYNLLAVAFGKWEVRAKWIPEFKKRVSIRFDAKTPDGRDSDKKDRLILDKVNAGLYGPISAMKAFDQDPHEVAEEQAELATLQADIDEQLRDASQLNSRYSADELRTRYDTMAVLVNAGMDEDEALARVGLDLIEDRAAFDAAKAERAAMLPTNPLDTDLDDPDDVPVEDE